MSSGHVSPDGKFIWTGSDWIPAPPQSDTTTKAEEIDFDTEANPSSDSGDINSLFSEDHSPHKIMMVSTHSQSKSILTKPIAIITVAILVIGLGFSTWYLVFSENSLFGESCINEIIYVENDDPPGGLIDSNTSYTYDSENNLILKEEISWEGAIMERTTYTYDSQSNLIEEYRTWDSDYSRIKMTYDTQGNILTEKTENSYSWDEDIMTINTYHTNNKKQYSETDVDIDGVIDEKETYEYDDDGNLRFIYTDNNMDGVNDEREIWYFDTKGRLLEIKTDEDMDGDIDDVTMVTVYNSEGNIIEQKSDFGNDGSYEFKTIFSYNPDGTMMRMVLDIDFEGTWLDSQSIIMYEYDNEIMTKKTTSRYDGDGSLTNTDTSYYGCIS